MNRFVSKGAVQGEQELVDPNNPDTAIPAPDVYVPQDNRTLYERLQTNKLKKEEEFADKTRLANLIKKLDPDEIDFLSDQQRLKRETQAEHSRAVKSELEKFRNQDDQGASDAALKAEEAALAERAKSIAAFSASFSSQPAKKKKVVRGLDGVVVTSRKRSDGDRKVSESDAVESKDDAKKGDAPTVKKVKVDDINPAKNPAAPKKSTATPLGLVSGYGSDDSDSE
ncbi:N-terminal domain of NEFA-interacting nuclear protein NIP30-domain-containing protein [Chytriomyces cf. hyalinus JEL632]|nr:N-terminal domain of NEFA-interacting nuclear protein NIP30-domain-containing protein [Chytriomyces cf. hyalinus JEL632]